MGMSRKGAFLKDELGIDIMEETWKDCGAGKGGLNDDHVAGIGHIFEHSG